MAKNQLILQKNENLLEQKLDDETIVLSPKGNLLHTFEGSARTIWNLIDGTRGIDGILARLTQEYQVASPTALSDLEAFLAELQRLSLIKIKNPDDC